MSIESLDEGINGTISSLVSLVRMAKCEGLWEPVAPVDTADGLCGLD